MTTVRCALSSPCRGSGARARLARCRGASTVRVRSEMHSEGSNPPHGMELAGGGYWWLNARTNESLIYGEQFVIARPRVGGPGLVPAPKAHLEAYRPPRGGAPAVRPHHPLGLTLSGSVVIDTECYEVLEEAASITSAGNGACVGMVYVGSGAGGAAEEAGAAARGAHPRRTRLVSFTCNLCGDVNTKPVNPHAWAEGSVFAQCEGCGVVHKLKDNLKIFHELNGPIFPPRHLRRSFMVQDILDRIEAKRRQGLGPAEGLAEG